MYSVPVKPTVYDGHLFRSLNEARFAAMLNQLAVEYQYEPSLYEFPLSPTSPLRPTHPSGTVKYIPDFRAMDIFFELKAKEPTLMEQVKASFLAEETGKAVYVVWPTYTKYKTMLFDGGQVELGWEFRKCTLCGSVGLKENCACALRTAKHPALVRAYKQCRQMKF